MFMSIISSTTQASIKGCTANDSITHYCATCAKPITQTCIQHILLLLVSSTKGAEGSSPKVTRPFHKKMYVFSYIHVYLQEYTANSLHVSNTEENFNNLLI